MTGLKTGQKEIISPKTVEKRTAGPMVFLRVTLFAMVPASFQIFLFIIWAAGTKSNARFR